MIKIKSLFIRDEANRGLVGRDVEPECQWVLDGEGTPTVKWDGSAVLVLHGIPYKRHTVKPGKTRPREWIHYSFGSGVLDGPGWIPFEAGAPQDRWHWEAFDDRYKAIESQTYELLGPKVQSNPYGLESHQLRKHGYDVLDLSQYGTGFDELSTLLAGKKIEGIVWHHDDGRMAKIKRRDFGHSWPVKA